MTNRERFFNGDYFVIQRVKYRFEGARESGIICTLDRFDTETRYFCNIEKSDYVKFHCYSFFLGKQITNVIWFKNLTFLDDDK